MPVEIQKVQRYRRNGITISDGNERSYTVYITQDGEEFLTEAAAKSYQKGLENMMEFKDIFSEKKGNLVKGESGLAEELISDSKSNILDFFWIKFNSSQIDPLREFLRKNYNVSKTKTKFINDDTSNQWIFLSIKKGSSNSNYMYASSSDKDKKTKFHITNNNIFWCTKDFISSRIELLQSWMPTIDENGNIVQLDDDNQFSNLDIREEL